MSSSDLGDDALWRACQRVGEPRTTWMERFRLVTRMLRARTPSEVRAATEAALAWLRDHPDDETVLSVGEQLARINPDRRMM